MNDPFLEEDVSNVDTLRKENLLENLKNAQIAKKD